MEDHKLILRSLLVLLLLLPFIRSDNCFIKKQYIYFHTTGSSNLYDPFDDNTLQGTKVQCSAITLSGNNTLESYINKTLLVTAKTGVLLNISNSYLPTIEAGAFNSFNGIRKLLIGKNGIKNIKPFLCNDMVYLANLQLYENNVSEIEEHTFDGCSRLTILNLANNKVTSLKNLNIPSLQKLNLENNLLSSISVIDFQNLKSLRILNLSSNSISTLDENLFNNLINLTELSISYNRISYVPATLFKSSISRLEMSHNKIRSINCNKFDGVIDLSYNELTTICNFGNSTGIDLSHNKISSVSAQSLKGLNELRTLNLHANNITEIDVNAFIDLFNLSFLNLSQNAINKLYIGTFHTLKILIKLDLANNNLESFEHGTFSGLNSLTILDLSNNNIQKLNEKVFYPLQGLSVLNLTGNLKEIIDVDTIVNYLPNLRTLSIDFDQIGCDVLLKMIIYFKDRSIVVQTGTSFKDHNIIGIACNPNLHEDSFSVDNNTEIVQTSTAQNDNSSIFLSIANSISSIHTVLALISVFFILFLIVFSVILIRYYFGKRRIVNMSPYSLKVLNQNE